MDSSARKKFQTVFLIARAFLAACIFAFTLILISTVGPWTETTFFPVVGKLSIDSVTQDEEGNAVITVRFNKLRNCDYVGLAWYKGVQSLPFDRVSVVLKRKAGDKSSPNRPLGLQRAGPWTIGLPPDELRENSFAQLTHKCPLIPWTSTTNFFP